MTPNNTNNSVMDNEHGYTLQLSILPVAIIVLIILGAAFFLMRGEFELPSFGKKETEVTRIDGYPSTIYTNVAIEKQRRVIKSAEELSDFLSTVDPERMYTPDINGIDFNKTYLIGVSTETDEESGTVLRIKRVIEDKENNSLTISIEEIKPGENCPVDLQSNLSVDIVALNKTDKTIEFDRVTKQGEACEAEGGSEDEAVEDEETSDVTPESGASPQQ